MGSWQLTRQRQVRSGVIESRLTLQADPASPRAAREFVRKTLTRWRCDHVVDVVVLLASELVTNAVLHARSNIDVVIRMGRGVVRVEIMDASTDRPVARPSDEGSMTGRGLSLVADLASAWGVDTTDGGKSVWFEVAA